MACKERSTALGALYREGKETLRGMEDVETDVRILLEEACHTDLQTLLVSPETEVGEEAAARYRSFLQRRKRREPVAYIIGHQGFMGLDFLVTEDVLIPEQDTETLVETALALLQQRSRKSADRDTPLRILDLCTGSGCILLSILHYLAADHIPAEGTGTDLSGKALSVAERNAARLGLEAHTAFLEGDLFAALERGSGNPESAKDHGKNGGAPEEGEEEADEKYDLLVSNPPYIPDAVIGTLAPEVRCSEPRMALSGGADGLDFYRRIAKESGRYLKKDGIVLLEIGYDQGESVPALLRADGYRNIRVLKDLGGNDRVVQAVQG